MNQRNDDYPAAHSMDTTWFALDVHGHVAIFFSGESGSVPAAADLPDAEFDAGQRLLELSQAIDIEFFVDDITEAADGKLFERSWEDGALHELDSFEHDAIDGCLLWLADESPLASMPQLARLPNKKRILAWAEELESSALEELQQRRLICRAWLLGTFPVHRMGVFEYEHGDMFENWVCGPYVRDSAPASPLRVSDMPPSSQHTFGTFRMPRTDFRRDVAIQPSELVECASWGQQWVSLNGEPHDDPEGDA